MHPWGPDCLCLAFLCSTLSRNPKKNRWKCWKLTLEFMHHVTDFRVLTIDVRLLYRRLLKGVKKMRLAPLKVAFSKEAVLFTVCSLYEYYRVYTNKN